MAKIPFHYSGCIVARGVASLFIEWKAGDIETETNRLTYQYKIDESSWTVPTEFTFTTLEELNDGERIFYVRAVDRDFNYSEPDTLTIIVDTIRPNVIIGSPAQGAIVGGKVQIICGVTDTDLVGYQVEYAEGKEPSDSDYILIADKQSGPIADKQPGPLDLTVLEFKYGQLTEWDTTSLKESEYTIRVRAIDKLDHTKDDTVTVNVDNTKPVVEINTPAQNQKLADKTTVIGKVEDLNIAEYTLQIIQGVTVKWGETTTDIPKSQSIISGGMTLSLVVSPSIERKDIDTSAIYGDAIVRLTATDEAGNQSVPTDVNVFYDNKGARPTARLETPKENDVISGISEIKGEAKSVGAFKSYAVKYAKGHDPSEEDWIDIGEGSNPSEEKLAIYNTTTLSDGKYSIQLIVTDENDYVSEQIVHIIIDNTKPVIKLTAPANEAIETGEVSIKGAVTDDNFDNYKVESAQGANPSTGWEQLGEISESEAIDRTWRTSGLDGLYSIRITAMDKAIPSNQAIFVRTITLDNTVAEAFITSPEKEQIVRDTVEIIGTANDDNFSDYQVFWGEGDTPSTWKEITNLKTAPVVNDVLASWDTTELDGIYTLRLLAHDKSQHEAPYSVPIIVDNTDPTAEILSPRDKAQVGGIVTLTGTATDANFKEYIVEYGEGSQPTIWIEASEDARRAKDVTEGKLFDWLSGDETGLFTLRLTAKDAVEHQSQVFVTVEVLPPIKSQEGGEHTSSDGLAMLYLSPRTLPKDTVITINPIPKAEIEAEPAAPNITLLGCAYDFGPKNVKIIKGKPATLSIRYDGLNIARSPDKRLAIAHFSGSLWSPTSGTVNAEEKTVTTAITQLGSYALIEMDAPQLESNATITQLTCQPRIFSPNGSGFNTETTISLHLSAPASVSIMIYNRAGERVRSLVENQPMSAGMNAVAWDGRGDDGSGYLASNMYIVVVKVGDKVAYKTVGIVNR